MQLAAGRLLTTSVSKPNAAFVLRGTGNTLAAAVYGSVPLPILISQGLVDAEGDAAAAEDFLSLFRLAPQA